MNHRHNTLRYGLARHAFRAVGLACTLEVPFLIPHTDHRPTDILVQLGPPAAGMPPDKQRAYDVTVRSPYTKNIICKAAQHSAAAAEFGDSDKLRDLSRTLRNALHLPTDATIPPMDWHFAPLAFDTLGAASARSTYVINGLARNNAARSHCAYSTTKLRLQQRISYAIWSTVATAILSRMPNSRHGHQTPN